MTNKQALLDAWLAGIKPQAIPDNTEFEEVWDPGFDGESRVVMSKLGPYYKLFEYPAKFFPRFYHQVYPLPVAEWPLNISTTLYGGLCTIAAQLTIHFQATFKYAERNLDALANMNAHIKTGYESLIKTIVDAELRNLRNGNWIESGLSATEKQIEKSINEALTVKYIKCRAICSLTPAFADLEDSPGLDGRFTQEDVYLGILQKNFEFREKQARERVRQEQLLEKERLEHLHQLNALQQQKLVLESENQRQLLETQEKQNADQFTIEAKLHEEKVNHEKHLQSIEDAAELKYRLEQQVRQHELELQLHAKKLEHEAILKEKEQQAEFKAQEVLQQEQQKYEEQLEAERIEHQTRLKEMQLQAEIKELELRVEVTKNKDAYLHRQIEWLVLDKQRAELSRAIKEAEHDIDTANRLSHTPPQ
ncbi:hypothetical protein [Methylomicrobium sp. Wu6]|uniref:hypothetical protein n=1 Tax=Methylomicrobium sp. Wu6 TaxID=3107928 RepID=UPI002DD69F32|nr:hypothetical protein [Methylomicrobium sp. Wu6]MEC4748190.1 hypothetical protein [Methylomicrobium sp. Wu6]